MSFAVNADFRYEAGYPNVWTARRYGVSAVRVISLPEMENEAVAYIEAGIGVIAVYTGESDAADHYIMRACSALQIGNEPEFAMSGPASWPTGTPDDFVNVWSHVANVLVPAVHDYLPLIGPGIWAQDYIKWGMIANRLPGLTAAAVHCYPEPSGQSPSSLRWYLNRYRGIRADLPLICTEWTAREKCLDQFRAIDTYCDDKYWYTWGPGVGDYHKLDGSPALGMLSLA